MGKKRSCEECKSVNDTSHFKRGDTEETLKGPLNFNSNHVIYLFEYKQCQYRIPYVGSTKTNKYMYWDSKHNHYHLYDVFYIHINIYRYSTIDLNYIVFHHTYIYKKQLLRVVPRKRCSENMQQIYSSFAFLFKSHFSMGVLL